MFGYFGIPWQAFFDLTVVLALVPIVVAFVVSLLKIAWID